MVKSKYDNWLKVIQTIYTNDDGKFTATTLAINLDKKQQQIDRIIISLENRGMIKRGKRNIKKSGGREEPIYHTKKGEHLSRILSLLEPNDKNFIIKELFYEILSLPDKIDKAIRSLFIVQKKKPTPKDVAKGIGESISNIQIKIQIEKRLARFENDLKKHEKLIDEEDKKLVKDEEWKKVNKEKDFLKRREKRGKILKNKLKADEVISILVDKYLEAKYRVY